MNEVYLLFADETHEDGCAFSSLDAAVNGIYPDLSRERFRIRLEQKTDKSWFVVCVLHYTNVARQFTFWIKRYEIMQPDNGGGAA